MTTHFCQNNLLINFYQHTKFHRSISSSSNVMLNNIRLWLAAEKWSWTSHRVCKQLKKYQTHVSFNFNVYRMKYNYCVKWTSQPKMSWITKTWLLMLSRFKNTAWRLAKPVVHTGTVYAGLQSDILFSFMCIKH